MLKDKLMKVKENLSIINRDYEFYADLEDHEMGDKSIYRLYYMDYRRCGETRGMYPNNLHITDLAF